ncbi:MAG: hypothetical protein J3Q66DRAFT_351828 [Benniella sp.]|nr:MAG: hypothetical protein J3Q66DRAFT_351828 [Benniella sp.]
MLKSLTALLLLGVCATISHAGCVNRGAQNSLRAHVEPARELVTTAHGCVDDCSVCSRGSFCAWDPLSCPNERFPYKCDRGYEASAPEPAPARKFTTTTQGCVDDCSVCPRGSFCAWDALSCPNERFPYKCDLGY